MENIAYYVILYFFVIIIKFFKLKNQLKTDFKERWYETFNGSLEIVYTASGFIIALLLNVPKYWIAAVVVMYALLLVFSALLESTDVGAFSPKSRTLIHVVISFIMITSTVISYSFIIPKVDINGNPQNCNEETTTNKTTDSSTYTFIVVIPYRDLSLSRHIGNKKFDEINLFFEVKVNARTPEKAIFYALSSFKSSNHFQPLYALEKSDRNMEIIQNRIIAIRQELVTTFNDF